MSRPGPSSVRRAAEGGPDLQPQLASFTIRGLFGTTSHEIRFPTAGLAGEPRVSILIGRNGVGKTTILHMIAGLLRLDFTPFRKVPFTRCELTLSTGDQLAVERDTLGDPLKVSFNEHIAFLHPEKSGAASPEDDGAVEAFRAGARLKLGVVHFELVDIHRSLALRRLAPEADVRHGSDDTWTYIATESVRTTQAGKLYSVRDEPELAGRVKRFVRDAQANYRRFFASKEPDFLPRIMARLAAPARNVSSVDDLLHRLDTVHVEERKMRRFGLDMNQHEIRQLMDYVEQHSDEMQHEQVRGALEAYVEMLESRAGERVLVANRLQRFEDILDGFMPDKRVRVDPRAGLSIESGGSTLAETQLSSGEYQLLFMMVSALHSLRSGTVVAIDEPELSLHVSWQRQLIKQLCACAAGASPLFIFATHAPTIIAEYADSCVELS